MATIQQTGAKSARAPSRRRSRADRCIRIFVEMGGFNTDFSSIYQDVDLCLRLRSMGKRNIFTPHAVFINRESCAKGRNYDRRIGSCSWTDGSS